MSTKRRSNSLEYLDIYINTSPRSKSNSLDSSVTSIDSRSYSISSNDENEIFEIELNNKNDEIHVTSSKKKYNEAKNIISQPRRRSRDKTIIIDKKFIHHSPVYSTFLELMRKFNKK